MTRRDKLEVRLRARPPQADFDDVRRVLERYGWTLDRNEGSHATFVKAGVPVIFTVPKVSGRWVKRTYLDKMGDLLGWSD